MFVRLFICSIGARASSGIVDGAVLLMYADARERLWNANSRCSFEIQVSRQVAVGPECSGVTIKVWWPWRGGPTRSHSEHGSETPQRRW